MSTKDLGQRMERWAHLRFSIIGGLLASPPQRGQLRVELQRLAGQRYRHPSQAGEWLSFGVSTLGAFVVASTVGLFGVHEHWIGWPVWTAAVSEVIAIVAGGALLTRDLPARSGRQGQHPQSARRAHLH